MRVRFNKIKFVYALTNPVYRVIMVNGVSIFAWGEARRWCEEGNMLKAKTKQSFTEGPIFWKITLFALPILLTGILQVFYNMADNIIVGQFSGDPDALGAVGSVGSLSTLIINLLLGISSGTAVVVSQEYGAKRYDQLSRAVHTALLFALFAGIAFGVMGILISRPALTLMATQPDLMDKAVLYLRIISIGIPANAIYNFGAAIIRSTGDSKTPLIILSLAGILNVILTLFFVLVLHMTVDGVALATIISQLASAVAVITVLKRRKNMPYAFSLKKLCFDIPLFKKILRIGIPAGISSAFFNVANVILTNGVNTFPKEAIKAYTITNNIDGMTYIACNSFFHAAMTFTGQNYGARKPDRIRKTLIYSLIQVVIVGIVVGQLQLIFSDQIASLYVNASDPSKAEVLALTKTMLSIFLTTYFLCGVMEVFSGTLRGLGYSLVPTLVALSCACGFRIFWRFVVFPIESFNTITGLLLCYPLSWILASASHMITFIIASKKQKEPKSEES